VYNKSNYKKEWNGTTNSGNELPDGTYFYAIEFASGKSRTGWVYLIRQR
jgi:gliding motility-associated-like protein